MNKIKYDNTLKQTIQKKSTNDYNIDENKKPPCLTTERFKAKTYSLYKLKTLQSGRKTLSFRRIDS